MTLSPEVFGEDSRLIGIAGPPCASDSWTRGSARDASRQAPTLCIGHTRPHFSLLQVTKHLSCRRDRRATPRSAACTMHYLSVLQTLRSFYCAENRKRDGIGNGGPKSPPVSCIALACCRPLKAPACAGKKKPPSPALAQYPIAPPVPPAEGVAAFAFDTPSPDDRVLAARGCSTSQKTQGMPPAAPGASGRSAAGAAHTQGPGGPPSVTSGELLSRRCHTFSGGFVRPWQRL